MMKGLLIALMLIGAQGLYSQYTCGAMTSKGTACKMRVKQSGDKCYHHSGGGIHISATGEVKESHYCGAITQKGQPCRRRVAIMGGRCFSHKEQR